MAYPGQPPEGNEHERLRSRCINLLKSNCFDGFQDASERSDDEDSFAQHQKRFFECFNKRTAEVKEYAFGVLQTNWQYWDIATRYQDTKELEERLEAMDKRYKAIAGRAIELSGDMWNNALREIRLDGCHVHKIHYVELHEESQHTLRNFGRWTINGRSDDTEREGILYVLELNVDNALTQNCLELFPKINREDFLTKHKFDGYEGDLHRLITKLKKLELCHQELEEKRSLSDLKNVFDDASTDSVFYIGKSTCNESALSTCRSYIRTKKITCLEHDEMMKSLFKPFKTYYHHITGDQHPDGSDATERDLIEHAQVKKVKLFNKIMGTGWRNHGNIRILYVICYREKQIPNHLIELAQNDMIDICRFIPEEIVRELSNA